MNVIFDLDGTLALCQHRRRFVEGEKKNWDAFYDACDLDDPNTDVVILTKELFLLNHKIWIFSGRSDRVQQKTTDWLAKYGICYHMLVMRTDGDYTPDEELKKQWTTVLELTPDNTLCVFDDRDKVVKMWRESGFTCLQVAEGDF